MVVVAVALPSGHEPAEAQNVEKPVFEKISGTQLRFTDPPPADFLKVASRLAGRTVSISADDLSL